MGAVALDASVAIGFLDPADAHHERAVAALREHPGSSLLMAASAYSETLVRPFALGLAEQVEEFVDRLNVEIVPADRPIARRAAELRAKHDVLRLPDAFVLATARSRQARLLTFDRDLASLSRQA
ncbi:MAG: PIN domain-containing protein [Solirubrobacterales bacterium]